MSPSPGRQGSTLLRHVRRAGLLITKACVPCLWPFPLRSSGLFPGRRRWSRTGLWVLPVLSWDGCRRGGCSAADRPPRLSAKETACFLASPRASPILDLIDGIYSHVQHRWGDSAGHGVPSKGVEVNGLVKGGRDFWKIRGCKQGSHLCAQLLLLLMHNLSGEQNHWWLT